MLATLLWGCSRAAEPHITQSGLSSHVLVVINDKSDASGQIASYYVQKRKIPAANVVHISCSSAEDLPKKEFDSDIRRPIMKAVHSAKSRIDYIVLTKGIPLRIWDKNGASVDGQLCAMDKSNDATSESELQALDNPYYRSHGHFNSAENGIYLVTRLDGYTVPDAKRLVDDALRAKPEKGPFLLDGGSPPASGDFARLHEALVHSSQLLGKSGFKAILDQTGEFKGSAEPLAGYTSWGSNDQHFDASTYKGLKFKRGALVQTYVSTSGRTFTPTDKGQSLIADLLANGASGAAGYVSEPYSFSLVVPDVLFDRYTRGFNLAESFYMAAPVIKWKEIFVGDPLCSPYA